MNAFVRQLAVLAVLWALCGLLLSPGRQQQMVQLAVSLLVMIALVSSLAGVLGSLPTGEWPVLALQAEDTVPTGYDRLALRSRAAQAEAFCCRTARKAGYAATARVALEPNGALALATLYLRRENHPPLMTEAQLTEAVAQQLAALPGQVCWLPWEGEAGP